MWCVGRTLYCSVNQKSSYLSRDLGPSTVSVVVSELGQTRGKFGKGWN